MALVASRLYAEAASACVRQVTHSLGEEAQHRVQESKKGKRAVQKGEKQGETSGVFFIKNKPIITSNRI